MSRPRMPRPRYRTEGRARQGGGPGGDQERRRDRREDSGRFPAGQVVGVDAERAGGSTSPRRARPRRICASTSTTRWWPRPGGAGRPRRLHHRRGVTPGDYRCGSIRSIPPPARSRPGPRPPSRCRRISDRLRSRPARHAPAREAPAGPSGPAAGATVPGPERMPAPESGQGSPDHGPCPRGRRSRHGVRARHQHREGHPRRQPVEHQPPGLWPRLRYTVIFDANQGQIRDPTASIPARSSCCPARRAGAEPESRG